MAARNSRAQSHTKEIQEAIQALAIQKYGKLTTFPQVLLDQATEYFSKWADFKSLSKLKFHVGFLELIK